MSDRKDRVRTNDLEVIYRRLTAADTRPSAQAKVFPHLLSLAEREWLPSQILVRLLRGTMAYSADPNRDDSTFLKVDELIRAVTDDEEIRERLNKAYARITFTLNKRLGHSVPICTRDEITKRVLESGSPTPYRVKLSEALARNLTPPLNAIGIVLHIFLAIETAVPEDASIPLMRDLYSSAPNLADYMTDDKDAAYAVAMLMTEICDT